MDELNKVQKLNEYLKELEKGQLKLEKIADPEVESLIKLASSLREKLLISAPQDFRQQAKENFLSAWQKKRLSSRRRLVKIIALAASFLLLFSGLANATWKSQPGSLLYPIKKGVQKIVVLLEKKMEKVHPALTPKSIRKGKKGKEKPGKERKPENKGKERKRKNQSPRKPNFPLKEKRSSSNLLPEGTSSTFIFPESSREKESSVNHQEKERSQNQEEESQRKAQER